jgi:hypothetical protein
MQQRLGETHPLTLACSVNLANCLGDAEELEAAMTLESETIAQLQQKLGSEHPDTLICQANFAITRRAAGQEKEAEELRAKLLDAFSRILGPGHPDGAQLRKWQRINRDLEPQVI